MNLECELIDRDTSDGVELMTTLEVNGLKAGNITGTDTFDHFFFEALVEMLYVRAKYVMVQKHGKDSDSLHAKAVKNVKNVISKMGPTHFDADKAEQYMNKKYGE